MCGIAGLVCLDGAPADPALARRMADRLTHRGPDADGVWHDGPVALAHRRLAVIDLSDAGVQPMTNEDGTVWIVFNGEVYNFPELREELIAKGHVFRSRTDTETLIHLYEEAGEAMVSRLRGMFAFAIWDTKTRTLFAARDRAGQKPFKYFLNDGVFAFASELKGLLELPGAPRQIREADIHTYLAFGYVFGQHTGFEHIRKLPPAHTLTLRDGKLDIRRYWRLDYRRRTDLSEPEARERLIELLDDATRARMISDVPLGAFLSGGVDSSAVVAMMSRRADRPVKTFSIGFDHENHSELPHARVVAELHNTEHHEFTVTMSAAEILPDLAAMYEEPYADNSALPSWRLCQIAREHVTVALNGDGGDESFLGYTRYDLLARLLKTRRRLDAWRANWLLAPLRALPGTIFHGVRRRAAAVAELHGADLPDLYARVIGQLTADRRASLYRPEFLERMPLSNGDLMREGFDSPEAGDHPIVQAAHWDFERYLAEDLCVKMDIASMAHGLETRSPFLDHHLVEFAASLPVEWKFGGGEKKRLLKHALEPWLPRDILYRKKQGFGVPIHAWFRGELREMFADTAMASGARCHQWLSPDAINTLFQNHQKRVTDDGYRLWLILMLEYWLRLYS